MINPPSKWLEHTGQCVLNDLGVGFFIYEDRDWINIVEVYWNEKRKILMVRTHPLTEKALKKINRTKKAPRRLSYDMKSGMTEKLILALSKMIGKEEVVKEPEEVKIAGKGATDSQTEEWMKKQGLI